MLRVAGGRRPLFSISRFVIDFIVACGRRPKAASRYRQVDIPGLLHVWLATEHFFVVFFFAVCVFGPDAALLYAGRPAATVRCIHICGFHFVANEEQPKAAIRHIQLCSSVLRCVWKAATKPSERADCGVECFGTLGERSTAIDCFVLRLFSACSPEDNFGCCHSEFAMNGAA